MKTTMHPPLSLCRTDAPPLYLSHSLHVLHTHNRRMHPSPPFPPPWAPPVLPSNSLSFLSIKTERKHGCNSILPLPSSSQRPSKPSVKEALADSCYCKVVLPPSISLCGLLFSPHPSLDLSLTIQECNKSKIAARLLISHCSTQPVTGKPHGCFFPIFHGRPTCSPNIPLHHHHQIEVSSLRQIHFAAARLSPYQNPRILCIMLR